MIVNRTERRLSAILAADVVGYSRLIARDETKALAALRAVRNELLTPSFDEHGGRIVKLMGDGLLVEFSSAVEALRCAMQIQTNMVSSTLGITLRIGVNVGDVVIEDNDILGDGVNIAARLESLAEPGGIAISGTVREHVSGRIEGEFRDLGLKELKNIDRPINVWFWIPEGIQAPVEPTLAIPEKPSIAVLPFDNMSGDPDQEYFADGIVEALTAALSRIRSFFVIARNSAFIYKGKSVNVQKIGTDLGVAYILEGSVQRAGARVRITVQLIETGGGSHIWADKFDGDVDDIFDLQDTITQKVAGALQPSIRLAEVERVRRKPPQNMGAYDYTMRAFPHVWRLEKGETAKGLHLLNKAMEIDPDYPLALALAAWCHAQQSVYNWSDEIETAKVKSLTLAEQAANLSTDDPLILTVLGTVHTFSKHYGAARVLLERAVSLDPNSAWAWSRLGWLDTYGDRPEEAIKQFEKALRLSPMDPMNFNNYVGIASTYQVAGDDNTAADMYLRALDERPNAYWVHRNLAPALWGAGRKIEAQASLKILRETYPELTVERFTKAMVFSNRTLERIGNQLIELGLPES